MTTNERRLILVSLLASVVTMTGCGDGGSSKTNATTSTASSSSTTLVRPTSSSAASTVAPTTTPSTGTTTTVPVPGAASAVWPSVASHVRYREPTIAARAFATDFLHMVAPIVGTFAPGDARSGEVPVRASARGPSTTVLVRRLGDDGSWWILGSAAPDIRLTEPAALAAIASPVRLRGRSTAFEATVNVSIREDDSSRPLAESFVMGGANGQFGPFDAAVKFSAATSPYGAIVMYTISPESGHVSEATVIRVGFDR
jgi:hypothetical protein